MGTDWSLEAQLIRIQALGVDVIMSSTNCCEEADPGRLEAEDSLRRLVDLLSVRGAGLQKLTSMSQDFHVNLFLQCVATVLATRVEQFLQFASACFIDADKAMNKFMTINN